jgi:hypothetical protein
MIAYMMGLSPEKIVNMHREGLRDSREDLSDDLSVTLTQTDHHGFAESCIEKKVHHARYNLKSRRHKHVDRRPLKAETGTASNNTRGIRDRGSRDPSRNRS